VIAMRDARADDAGADFTAPEYERHKTRARVAEDSCRGGRRRRRSIRIVHRRLWAALIGIVVLGGSLGAALGLSGTGSKPCMPIGHAVGQRPPYHCLTGTLPTGSPTTATSPAGPVRPPPSPPTSSPLAGTAALPATTSRRFADRYLAFSYPSGWEARAYAEVSSFTDALVFLSSQPMHPPCTTGQGKGVGGARRMPCRHGRAPHPPGRP
jgi:hypothetical protein